MYSDDQNRLFRLFRSTVPPGKRPYQAHHHTAFEITHLIRGEGKYRVGEKIYDCTAGDTFIFGTDEVHYITEIKDKEALLINIWFEPRFIWSGGSDPGAVSLLRVFLNRPEAFENRLPQDENAAEIIKMLFATEGELQKKQSDWESMTRAYLLRTLVLLNRSIGTDRGEAPVRDMAGLRDMESAMRYMDAHITEELSLAEIAATARMSRAHFCTVFKRLNGISPWDYITIKRVERAIILLKTTDMTRLSIAMQCGFNTMSNFYYAFRRITGKTPGDYSAEK